MAELSVIIPARNEVFLQRTIQSVLEAAHGDTEVIAICDGYWPTPSVQDHPRVIIVHHTEPVGQRAAVNEGARLSRARYICKTDAHSMFDEGFDVKLMRDCEPDWTVIPRMYNLDAFKWVCPHCMAEAGMGPKPAACQCGADKWEMIYVWEPKRHKRTDYMYIDGDLRAQYWRRYGRRPQAQGDIVDVMTGQGACWFQERQRFLDLGGLDEGHGGWGQIGVEVACKAWLSGGRQVVNKKTWFAHMFRTRPGFQFPYTIHAEDIQRARSYSRELWFNGKWPLQKRPLQWLVDKFAPVPTWNGQLKTATSDLTLLYYTANKADPAMARYVREQLQATTLDTPIVSVSQQPLDFGRNICVGEIGQSLQNVYRQVLVGAKAATTEYVAMVEDDCLYTPEHFAHRPSGQAFAYNLARWNLHTDGPEVCYTYRDRPILSQCIAPRQLLIEALERREPLEQVPDKYCGEPGLFESQLGLPPVEYETFRTERPNVVICHRANTMGRKLHGADKCSDIPYWGSAKHLTDTIFTRKAQAMPKFGRGSWQRSQHSYIGSIIFAMAEIMAELPNFADRRRPGRAEWRLRVFKPFIERIANGEQLDDAALKADPCYEYFLDLHKHRPNSAPARSLQLMREWLTLYTDIRDNGLKNPLDMYRIGTARLVLHRGWRRLVIMNVLHERGLRDFSRVPVRVFKTKRIFELYNPSREWHAGPIAADSIHALGQQQFATLGCYATDKFWVHGYTQHYDRHFAHLRNKPVKLLEIGVFRGASLLLWRAAFRRGYIYGLDKNTAIWQKFLAGKRRVKVFVGRQEDSDFMRREVVPAGPYDIIIDDGAHTPDAQLASFEALWPHVAPQGIYVIEDMHGNYWSRRAKNGPLMAERVKTMLDDTMGTNDRTDVYSVTAYYNIAFIEKNRD